MPSPPQSAPGGAAENQRRRTHTAETITDRAYQSDNLFVRMNFSCYYDEVVHTFED